MAGIKAFNARIQPDVRRQQAHARQMELIQRAQQKMQERSTGTSTYYSWQGKSPSQMNTLEKTAYLRIFRNNETARTAFSALANEMQTVGSRHYSPYSTGKSNQKEAMEFFGLDSFDQDWLDSNRFLLSYTNQLDWTDSISTSGQAKWSDAQKAGYYYHMLSEAEQTTKQAESEWQNLRAAMQRNFNEYEKLYGKAPSYDQLMSYIDMSDYSTLQKMDKVYTNVEDLVRLNRPVEYTPETMIGVYAALLNGKDVTGDGNWFEEAVQYTMKPIRREQEQPQKESYAGWTKDQIEAKRQEIRKNGTRADLAQFEADLYASTPHLDSVDSESYFSESYYDQAFLDKYAYLGEYAEQLRNRDGKIEKPTASDPWWYNAAYEYDQIRSREAETKQAEQEWSELRKEIAVFHANDPQMVLESIDWDEYPTLKKLRDGKDVDLNRAVYFSDDAILGVLRATEEGQRTDNDDFDYALYESVKPKYGPEVPPAEEAPKELTPLETLLSSKPEIPDAPLAMPSREPDIQEPQTEINPEEFELEEPYQFNPDAYFGGPTHDQPVRDQEQLKEERQRLMDDLWEDMTKRTNDDAVMIQKEFYAANGRPMMQSELVEAGIAPRSMEGFDPSTIQLGVLDVDKKSIFDDTLNHIAAQYKNPQTGKAYENMDELIANDPALLSNMLDYIETEPRQQTFSTVEVEHLNQLRQYQDDLSRGSLDNLFKSYADDNAVDDDRLQASLQYIIETGLTLEEKDALGLLGEGEDTQLMAERSQELFVNRGNELTRAMAIGILGAEADEFSLNIMDAAISHLFAIETGAAGGILKSQFVGFNAVRDLWSAVATPLYEHRLGEDYTLDQACEIDPMLRGLTAAVDKGNAIIDVASPDMSNFNYGAAFTQHIVNSAVSQKVNNFYSPIGQNFTDSMLKRMKLGGLDDMLASDKRIKRVFGKALSSFGGSASWMLRSMSDGAQEAREMEGVSEAEAVRYGIYKGATTGFIEGALGQAYDSILDNGGNLISKGLSKLTKGSIDTLLKTKGVTYLTNIFQQAFSESLEEAAEMPLDKVGKSLFLDQALKFSGEDVRETWDNMRLSFVTSLFTSAFFALSADPGTKLYTESEKVLDRIANGQATVDEIMEYAMLEAGEQATQSEAEHVLSMAAPQKNEQEAPAPPAPPALIQNMAESNLYVRDSVRIMQEEQAALDNAAIDMAADAIVEQQINEGAMDDLIGPASPNAKTLMAQEVNLETLMQKAQQEVERMEQLDQQKKAAIYEIVSNGLSPEQGAARQTVHNFDEMRAAAQKRYDEWQSEILETQTAFQLEQQHIQAQVEQRKKEMRTAVREEILGRFEKSRKKADQLIADMQAERDAQEPKAQEKSDAPAGSEKPHVADYQIDAETEAVVDDEGHSRGQAASGFLVDQIIGADTGDDPYEYFSGSEKAGASRQEANQAAHDSWKDVVMQPDDAMTDADWYSYWPVERSQYHDYKRIIQRLRNKGVDIELGHVREKYGDASNDPLAQSTDYAMRTIARTTDNKYVLISDDGTWVRASEDGKHYSEPDVEGKTPEEVRRNRLEQSEATAEYFRHLSSLSEKERRAESVGLTTVGKKQRNTKYLLLRMPDEGFTSDKIKDYVVAEYKGEQQAMEDLLRMADEQGMHVKQVATPSSYHVSYELMKVIPNPKEFSVDMTDPESFEKDYPNLLSGWRTEQKLEERSEDEWRPEDLSVAYDSKLAANNPNYAILDNSNGFNLVVKSSSIRLDGNDTGRHVDTNLGINTVSDAVKAIQGRLTNIKKSMEIDKSKGVTREHDPMRLIYTTHDKNGQPVNLTYQDYVDPKTGEPRIPTANELLAISSRITVNWPTKQIQLAKGGKWITTQKLEFTLELSDLSPNVYDPKSPDASRTLVRAELRRAEAEYDRYVGSGAEQFTTKLRYFSNVCEANINSYLQAINQLSSKMESGNITDAELRTMQKSIEEYAEALRTWQYAADIVAEARDAKSNVVLDAKKIVSEYDRALKKTGNASLDARLQLASSFRHSINTTVFDQLKAAISADTTMEQLMARDQQLTEELEWIMNARNRAAVLNHRAPSQLDNEPLAQAIMEEQDIVRQQMLLLSAPSQNLRETQEQASDAADDTTEASVTEEAENAAEKPTEQLSQNAENEQTERPEEVDPVQKQQEMDRAYLGAIIGGEEISELTNVETGESTQVTEVTNESYPDAPAEELSYATPVEEYMERAGLERNYPSVNITDTKSHGQVEQMADTAYKTVKVLTDRIDTIQATLQSGVLDKEQASAIQTEKQRYIDERNRIKAEAKRMDAKLSSSNYYSEQTVRNIAVHCLETGEVDWEAPEVRARQINEIYENDLSRMKQTLQSKLVAGRTTALTIKDVAEIIGSAELDKQLRMRHDVGFELSKRLHQLDEALQICQQQREEVLKQIEQSGRTIELEAALGRIDEEINTTASMIENGRKSMRMYFDSGSELSLEDILSGKGGGRLPLNVMNHVYAILKDIDAHSKNTNRPMNVFSHADNPLRVMEHFAGEWAPVMNALYIAQTQTANARMNAEHGRIVNRLQKSGLKHAESENAMLYAEGKMTEKQFEDAYPDPAERDRIKKAIVEYRNVYDALYKEVNQALIRNGFDPIPYRKDYIHHMRDAQSGIAKACDMLGIRITEDELPTSLAGHTEETKPRRGFMSGAMKRHGDETSYDLERNTMAYVNAAMRVIHHTDNISRLRQLEGIMDQTVNKRAVNAGLAQYAEVVDTNDLKRPGRNNKTAFSSMREWVTEYTNLLAGKQSFIDRPVERLAGRNALQIANGLKNMTGSSIVVGNLNIATSNILPVMTMAGISPVQTAAALADVVRSGADGMRAFEAQSEFLTARYADQQFSMNWMDTAKEIAMIPFEAIDRFAANTVVRAYQKIGMNKGWTPEVAMKWADQMAWRMMASTNAGEGANIMGSKTAGILLQFSREGINNLQFLAHDLKEISGGGGDWLKKLLGIMLGGWLYNTAFNKTTAAELFTPTMKSIREWDSGKSVLENMRNAAGNYAEMLNPTNLGTGGDLTELPLVSNLTEMGQAVWSTASSASELNGEGVRDGLIDFFCATLGFVPGGLSIERLATGIGDYYRGYTTDSAGNIKFTIDNDLFSAGSIHDAIFALLLSSSGTKGGREYTRSGYQAMTKTQTEAFHSQKATGMSNQDAFNSVMGHAEETGNRNASKLVLPGWAAEKSDTDWMQTVLEKGAEAYPKQTPDQMKINGIERELTEAEKKRFDQLHEIAYRMRITKAIANGSSLSKAADKAYSTAYENFRKEMED